MLSVNAFVFFMLLLLLATLLEHRIEKLHIPFSFFLVVLGFASSEIATKMFSIDLGINWENFRPIIIHFILPILIFQSAIMTDVKTLRENAVPIIMLTLPLLLISAGIIATGVYFGINYPDGFPWIAALLTGAILSATDPAAILSILRKYRVSKRIILLLETEGLFNDATAVVLFSVVISLALHSGEMDNQWLHASIKFLSVFFGGIATGIMIGIIAHMIIRAYDSGYIHILTTIISAYTSFILAQDYFGLSGVMAVLATGLIIRLLEREDQPRLSRQFVVEYWDFTASIAETLIFLLAGVTITIYMFTDQWLAILIGIASCLLARWLIIFGSFPFFNLLSRSSPVTFGQQVLLTWGGTRGAITLALALSLPLTLDYWYTIQSIAYGVVLFTLIFQTTSIIPLIRHLKLQDK